MTPSAAAATPLSSLPIDFDHRRLVDTMIGDMAELLESTAGYEDACICIGSIAARLATEIDRQYRTALGVQRLSRPQFVAALIDVYRRSDGAFVAVVEDNDDRIVLNNHKCPLGDAVINRPSLCMLTSNIFGVLAANSVGYAAVDLEQTIAGGADLCRVVIHLKRPDLRPGTREYFRDDASAASD